MKRLIHLFFAMCVAVSVCAQEDVRGADLLMDGEQLYTTEQIATIGALLDDFHRQSKTREIVIVTIDTVEPFDDFQSWAADFALNFTPIRPEDDDALVVMMSRKMGRVRIATAADTKHLIEPQVCQSVISRHMMPYLAKGDFFSATTSAITVLSKAWK